MKAPNRFENQINSFKNKSDEEIINYLFGYWKINEKTCEDGTFKVVASYHVGKDKNGYDLGYFMDVRNLNGDILYYPFHLGSIKIYVSHNDAYTKEPLWQIRVRLSTKTKYRETNPFLLEFSDILFDKPKNSFVDRLEKEKLIRNLFNKRGATIDDAQIIANALNILIGDVRTDSERFLFELLQNADDQPYADDPVNVTFKTLIEHLLVLHNGNPFSSKDVQVISSIGDKSSDKISDKEKTGYKGIGFKSVFSDSDTVYINSGGFSFAFDKNSPVYNKVPDINAIPWQIKPIWQERYRLPKEVVKEQDYFTSRVGIALNAGLENIVNYNSIIPNLLADARFMLFLRHIEVINFESNRESIVATKKTYGEKVVVGNNSNNTEWIVKDFEFEIPQSIKEKLAVDGGNKIPQKLKTATRTKISFAINYTKDKIERVEKSLLFTYLPTKVDQFKFPFLINADFIVNSSREYVHDDNIWNKFLFEYIGKKTIEWVRSISSKAGYLNALPTQMNASDSQLFSVYRDAYTSALASESFILNHKGELARQDEIIIDETGLAEILGADLFCKLSGTERSLPSKNIGCKILLNQIFQQVEHVSNENIHCKLINSKDLNDWYIHTDQKSKDYFNKWLIDCDYRDIINTLPMFEFDDGWKTPNEIDDDENYIVISTKFSHLKNTIVKLGLHCSNFFDNTELYQIDEIELFNRVYKKIEKHNQIVKDLHHYKDICAGVGQDEYYYGNYFSSLLSALREGNFLSYEQEQIIKQEYSWYNSMLNVPEMQDYNEFITRDVICNSLPNIISQFVVETALTPEEKLLLINTDFYGIGEARIKEIELFYNIENASFHNGGESTPLQHMLPYRVDAPDYVKPYMICERENFLELQKYLISPENEFEKVVMPHLSEIIWFTCSRADIVNQYKLEGKQLRSLIDTCDSNESLKQLLPYVESSDDITKKFFLSKIVDVRLSEGHRYNKDSFEYRVLKLALYVYGDTPSDFSSKIYFNGQCIKDFSISDDVVCDFYQNGETKKAKLSLAKLLPQYQNQSDSIDKIKALFETKKDFDKFFETKSKSVYDVHKELNQHLAIPESYFSEWNVNGNAQQFLFATYYRRQKKGWNNLYVPKIDLNNETDEFVHELLDFLFDNSISIEESPFTYHIKEYFIDKYFDSDYIFESEQLLPTIEKWANDDKKIKYLKDNGVQTFDCNSIQFRKLFLDEKPVDFIEKLSDKDLKSGIEFIATASGFSRPFLGENQKIILFQLKDKASFKLSHSLNNKKIEDNSKEWDSKEYHAWIEEHYPHIFIYPGILPYQLYYEDELLLDYDDDRFGYYYDKKKKKLFISNAKKIDDILFEVGKEGQTDFDLDDYKELCLDGKISVSKEDIENKDKKIETLEESNRKKDEIIEQYREKYGDLTEEDILPTKELHVPESNFIEYIHSNAQNEINRQSGKVIERDGLSREEQVAAHREAEKVIKDKLEIDGYDCSNWILDEDSNDPFKKWQSVNQVKNIINPNKEPINLVIKSAKGGYIFLSATDFEFLTSNSSNVLMVWDGKNVHSVTAEDIFNKDSNVNLIFDTEYTPKHYYAALSKVFQYIKRTTFAVKNPSYNAYDTIKSFGMDSKTEGVQELFDDNDL